MKDCLSQNSYNYVIVNDIMEPSDRLNNLS